MDLMGDLNCNEYENLRKRRFGEYSAGHRAMYEVPIRLMAGKKFSIIEAGFGIGWGLQQMLKADVVDHYIGYEPNADAFNYTKTQISSGLVELRLGPFKDTGESAQHVFCIEVFEHVPPSLWNRFLLDLRLATAGTLWLSTPNRLKQKREGVVSPDEMKDMLEAADFPSTTVHQEQWTTLYIAQ